MTETAADRAALLRGVLDAPDDDAPRLVFADWLDDRGDAERAEFVRLQCALARLSHGDGRRVALFTRERELLRRNAEAWRRELPDLGGLSWGLFARGFVDSIDAWSWAAFRRHAPAAFAAAPVRHVRVRSIALRQGHELVDSPYLGRLRSLEVAYSPFDEQFYDRLGAACARHGMEWVSDGPPFLRLCVPG